MTASIHHDCQLCRHHKSTTAFDLCMHPESKYTAEGKTDQHTVGHMRRHQCGPEARFFEGKPIQIG